MSLWPPDKLDTQAPDNQGGVEFQFFTSLLRFRSGWFANIALERRLPLEFMDALSYTTIIEPAEPLARRRGSALDR